MKLPSRYVALADPKFSGGMSHVRLYHDEKLDRDVVVKSLAPGVDQGRLLDEIRALQSIRSGYVVQIYDVVENDEGDIVAIIEEYCPGTDLSDEKGKIDEAEFVRIGYQFISGISEIHHAGVINRDIKPQNVRVDALGDLTIIDFGLARTAGNDAQTQSIIGTSGFMAPELFKADATGTIQFSESADIFAFASSMYLMSEGTLPLEIRHRPPDMNNLSMDFHSLRVAVDVGLASLLNSCLEEDPDNRPTASHLHAAFKRVLLFDKHRALLNLNGSPQYLDSSNRVVTASVAGLGSVVIEYNGNAFTAAQVSGDVFVNNSPIAAGHVFPASCVIAFGGPDIGAGRVYVTFDISHPGVEA